MASDQTGLFDDRYGARGLHSVYRCTKCGFGQTVPGISRGMIGQFYAKHYPLSVVDPHALRSQVRIIPSWQAMIEGVDNTAHWHTRRGQRVLDIGSASGLSLLEITALGGEAYGVEPDPYGAKIAKSLGLKVFRGFITDNPFPKLKFDLITASQVLEHEPDPAKFLLAARKKLKPHGQLVLSFPNYNALYRHLFGRHWLHWHIPYHLNFFTHDSLAILAKESGFRLQSIRTITPNLWTVLQLRALLTPVKEGTPSAMWVQAQASRKSKKPAPPNQPSYFLRIAQLFVRFSVWLIMPINRLVDILGLGESFLIVLTREEAL